MIYLKLRLAGKTVENLAEGLHKKFISYNALADWFDFGGIRIEEDLLITAEGSQLLGDPVAKSISEIEEIRKEALS